MENTNNPNAMTSAVNQAVNERGGTPFLGLGAKIKYLQAVLMELMRKDNDGQGRILNDVILCQQLAGSINHYEFIEHVALNLRYRLTQTRSPNPCIINGEEQQQSIYKDSDARNRITSAFIDALCEVPGDFSNEEISLIVHDKMEMELATFLKDASGALIKDEQGGAQKKIEEWADRQGGKLINPCPFGINGEPKLEKANLDCLMSYINNDFRVTKIKGNKRGIVFWDRCAYTEDPNRIADIIRFYLKSYGIHPDAYEIKKYVDAISVSGEAKARDKRILIPTPTGLIHVFNKTLDKIEPQERSSYPELRPFYQGNGFEVCQPDPDVIVTRALDAEFNPNAYDPDVVQVMREWSNYSQPMFKILCQEGGWILSGSKFAKGIAINVGESGCGKSAFCDVLKGMLGENKFSTVSAKQLANEQGFFLHEMVNVRANFSEEVDPNELSLYMQNTLKDISGGDTPQTINEKNKGSYKAIIQANLVFNTNVLPPVSDEATRQRMIVVPFLNPKSKKGSVNAKALPDRKSAQSHFLNLFISGLVELSQSDGDFFSDRFTQCKELSEAMAVFEANGSTEYEWTADELANYGQDFDRDGAEYFCFTKQPRNVGMPNIADRTIEALFKKYTEWCKQNKRIADKRTYFIRLEKKVWARAGIYLEVAKCNYHDATRGRLKGNFLTDPNNLNAHPDTKQANA